MSTGSSTSVHCPTCGKPILSQVALAEGSRFVMKCPNPECGIFIKVIAGFNYIEKRALLQIRETRIIKAEVKNDHEKTHLGG